MGDTPHRAWLSLGSNLGDRYGALLAAIRALNRMPDLQVITTSSFYETTPVGVTDQPNFYNAAVEVETKHSPRELLHQIQQIEQEQGRVRIVHWGPRTLDIDILLYDQEIVNDPDLIIPHPRMQMRLFVLMPLAEIAENVLLPDKRTVQNILQEKQNSGNNIGECIVCKFDALTEKFC